MQPLTRTSSPTPGAQSTIAQAGPPDLTRSELTSMRPAKLVELVLRFQALYESNHRTRRKQERELARMEAELHRLKDENARYDDLCRKLIVKCGG